MVTGPGGPREGCLSDGECDAGRCSLEIIQADLSGKEDKEALARRAICPESSQCESLPPNKLQP